MAFQAAFQPRNQKKHLRLIFFIGIGLVLAGAAVYAFWDRPVASPADSSVRAGYAKLPDEPAPAPQFSTSTPATSATPAASAGIKLPILLYHYVEHVQDKNDVLRQRMNVNPEDLAAVIAALQAADYRFFWVQDVPGLLADPKTLPKNAVVLTFDDGYEDFYTDVFPILRLYGVKATLYVVNNFIDRPGYVTTGELKDIVASGLVEIGAHTLDHVDLKGKPRDEVKRQIENSEQDLEQRFGVVVQTFAYPYGHFDEAAISAVRDAKFVAAVSTLDGWRLSEKNLFVLPRLHAGQFTGENVVFKLGHLR
ncbi:MAG: polysaccharide deacetylase family protein [Patescibacteria group bacterium]|nr:polysaccharide deacetylase family protein [Patescibacteria group bacterium]